jgi:LmbE family N-acetylglucosaminyl deacetylase
MATTLFLLAHQDDEIGVLAEIEHVLRIGNQAAIAYLTDGATRGVTAGQRNTESLRVLGRLGVSADDTHFLGEAAGIGDGQLIFHLEPAYTAAASLLARLGPNPRLVMHGWEGGHQDHDAVHIIGVAMAHAHGLLATAHQFPLYRAPLAGRLPYVMLRPMPANGPVEIRSIPVAARLRYLALCLSYRSQRKTFAGLLPFIAADYAWYGRQVLQPLSVSRLREPPHAGAPLYERWGRMTWRELAGASATFLEHHGLSGPVPPPTGS